MKRPSILPCWPALQWWHCRYGYTRGSQEFGQRPAVVEQKAGAGGESVEGGETVADTAGGTEDGCGPKCRNLLHESEHPKVSTSESHLC